MCVAYTAVSEAEPSADCVSLSPANINLELYEGHQPDDLQYFVTAVAFIGYLCKPYIRKNIENV